jgi:V/A-type H+-transporting ATPase subunit K
MTIPQRLLTLLLGAGALLLVGALLALASAVTAFAQGDAAAGGEAVARAADPASLQWAMLSAALAVAASSIAAGYAVARVGSAGVGAVTEKPELMGRVLVFVGLAEGIAIYGLIVAILILNRVS